MNTFIESLVEKRVEKLLKDIESISVELIDHNKKESNSILELATKGKMPEQLYDKLSKIHLELMLLNVILSNPKTP